LNTFIALACIHDFCVLETARVPTAYTSVLHLYETMGWWRKADWIKVHFAESWNELHHLLLPSLWSRYWIDRFVAHTGAFVYYWIIVLVYIFSPRSAYNFMQQVEEHAYHTYDAFLKEHGEELLALPAPEIAAKYNEGDLIYLMNFKPPLTSPRTSSQDRKSTMCSWPSEMTN